MSKLFWMRIASAFSMMLTLTAHAQSADKKFWAHVGPSGFSSIPIRDWLSRAPLSMAPTPMPRTMFRWASR